MFSGLLYSGEESTSHKVIQKIKTKLINKVSSNMWVNTVDYSGKIILQNEDEARKALTETIKKRYEYQNFQNADKTTQNKLLESLAYIISEHGCHYQEEQVNILKQKKYLFTADINYISSHLITVIPMFHAKFPKMVKYSDNEKNLINANKQSVTFARILHQLTVTKQPNEVKKLPNEIRKIIYDFVTYNASLEPGYTNKIYQLFFAKPPIDKQQVAELQSAFLKLQDEQFFFSLK